MEKRKCTEICVFRKKRIRWERILGLILIIAIIYGGINQFKKIDINKQKNEQESNIQASNNKIEVEIEGNESQKMKLLIQELQTKYKLNESNFAFFYYNIQEKEYYFYNKDTYFTGASTIKMPIAMTYYDDINEGTLDKEGSLTYKEGCYEEGNGSTAARYNVGDQVPIKFLIEQSIVNSDNTANNILIENVGYKETKYKIARYAEMDLPENFYSENITSAQYGYNIVNYLYTHQSKYEELIGLLKKSSGGEYLKKYIKEYDVAHKYGSYDGYVHDYGIVFSENPYLIGVYTKGIANANEVIAKISKKVLEKNKEI